MPRAVEVRGLVKEYGALRAVNGIDFDVEAGSVFAFLGPNGAGKTTTVEVLEGLRRATAGSVSVLGLDPWSQGSELHRRIGVIPQEFRFFEKITPGEAVAYYAALFDRPTLVDAVLERVVLLDKKNDRFENLSGGQKQKLGLALALVSEPELLFLDEPTTGLDPHARRSIWEVIRALRREGRTIFLTTHYLEEAQLLADRVAIIDHGRILTSGTADSIIAEFGRPDRLRLDGPPELAEALRRTTGRPVRYDRGRVEVEVGGREEFVRLLSAAEASGLPWSNVTTVRDSLEDVFVRLVGSMDEGEVRAAALPSGAGGGR